MNDLDKKKIRELIKGCEKCYLHPKGGVQLCDNCLISISELKGIEKQKFEEINALKKGCGDKYFYDCRGCEYGTCDGTTCFMACGGGECGYYFCGNCEKKVDELLNNL